MTNAERYITPKLKELEDMILGAEDKLFALEYDLFCQVREELAAQIPRIQGDSESHRAAGCLCIVIRGRPAH